MNDAARPEKRFEIDVTDCGRAGAIVKRRIGVRADVRRERDRADVDGTAGTNLRRPSLLVTGIAGKDRRRGVERW